jgi:DNA-binding SARP family transcriptional activator
MTHLSVALLGTPRVECDGLPIAVDTRKAIAFLAYLAVTGEPHGRDALADLLWSEYDGPSARAALHNNIADLLHSGGRTEAAMSHLKSAVAIYAEIGVESGAVQPQIWKLAEW